MPEETQPIPVPPPTAPSGLADNVAGALAYFTFIPAIIFLIVAPYNQKSFIRFHAWQSLLLTVAAIVINIALGIVLGIALFILPFFITRMLWTLIDLAWLAVWLVFVVNAYNGKRFKIPVLGDIAEKQAGA